MSLTKNRKRTPVPRITADDYANVMMPGYDDPESELFVAVELRQEYALALSEARQQLQGPRELQHVAEQLVQAELLDKLGEAPTPPATNDSFINTTGGGWVRNRSESERVALDEYAAKMAERREFLATRSEDIMFREYQRVQNLAVHWRARYLATQRYKQRMEREKANERSMRAATCPVCGTLALSAESGQPIASRSLTPHFSPRSFRPYPSLRSCAFCYDEALDQVRRHRAAAATGDDPRRATRADAVRAALDL